MNRKWGILWIMVLVFLVFSLYGAAAGSEPTVSQASVGSGFTYQGRLDDNGSPANGAYDFRFRLYDAASGGGQVGSTITKGNVPVSDGLFTVTLDFGAVFDGTAVWLDVGVRPGGSSGSYTPFTPRQALTAAPYALSLQPGAMIQGDVNGSALLVKNMASSGTVYGVFGRSESPNGAGVFGYNRASSGAAFGVMGESDSSDGIGVFGTATDTSGFTYGVFGESYSTWGVGGNFVNHSDGVALYASGGGAGRYKATLLVENNAFNMGMAAYLINGSNYHNAHFSNFGTGGVLYLQNGGTDAFGSNGGDFITAVNSLENDTQFRVSSSGGVSSDGSFTSPAADFAEMLPAVPGLEPGDVLVIGLDGQLALSTEPYQSTVVGVYSTEPGFIGGQPVDGSVAGEIPLAVVGVVPVKASADNGPIVPGDLLTTASTPGYAMRAGENPAVGTVLGKALAGLETGDGLILMLVMLQ